MILEKKINLINMKLVKKVQKINLNIRMLKKKREVAASMPMMGYVPADGLTSKPDLLHFDTASLKTFGRRYYNVFCTLEDHNKEFPDKPDMDAAIRSDLELL